MARQTNHLRGVLLAVAGAAFWSPDGLLLRIVQADAWQSLFWRMSSFAAALMLILVVRERGKVGDEFRAIRGPGIWVAFFLASVNACFTYSITHTAVANALVIFATIPLFGAVLGWVFLREAVPVRTSIAMTIGVLSIGAIFAEKMAQGSVVGDLLALAAALLFAGNLTVVRQHPDVPFLPPLVLGGLIGAAIGAGFSDPFAVSRGQRTPAHSGGPHDGLGGDRRGVEEGHGMRADPAHGRVQPYFDSHPSQARERVGAQPAGESREETGE